MKRGGVTPAEVSPDELSRAEATPAEARRLFRAGLVTPTAGWCRGFAQANLLAVPRSMAFDALLFAQRNPGACPVLDVIDSGEVTGAVLGEHADVRTDAPAYRIWRDGELAEEVTDAREWWTDDMVGLLIGCSFTFEHPLVEAGVPVRHLDAARNVPMYRTNRPCRPAGRLRGDLVVSLRMIPEDRVAEAVSISARFPAVHGAPVHVGDPAALGIADPDSPDFGDPPVSEDGDVPVFWACGVTPQVMIMESRPPLAITHAPGHMLITDTPDHDFAVP